MNAPPATTFPHFLHSQIPVQALFTVFLPQKAQVQLGVMRPREEIRAVLADFDLLHDLTEGGTVSRSVLAANTDLLSSLALQYRQIILMNRVEKLDGLTQHQKECTNHSAIDMRTLPLYSLFLEIVLERRIRINSRVRGVTGCLYLLSYHLNSPLIVSISFVFEPWKRVVRSQSVL